MYIHVFVHDERSCNNKNYRDEKKNQYMSLLVNIDNNNNNNNNNEAENKNNKADRKIKFTCSSHHCRVFTLIGDGVKGSSCDGRTGTRTLNFVC